jgi:hypothetical protein
MSAGSAKPPVELSVELLFGRDVRDADGEVLGQIADLCAGDEDGELVVRYYLVVPAQATYRISVRSLLLEVLKLFRLPLGGQGYRIPWDEMDLADPERPRVRLRKEQMERFVGGR